MIKNKFDYRIIGSGLTTIVVETGIGNSYFAWLEIAEHLSDDYTILLYHRLGYGDSEYTDSPRTTENIAKELFELVSYLSIDKFIYIAHSFGGLCAQHFTLMYPEKVSHLLLIDSASPRLEELELLDTPFLNKHCSIEAMVKMNLEFSTKTKEEILKKQDKTIMKNKLKLSEKDFEAYKNFVISNSFNITVANEFSHWIEDGKEIQKIKKILNIPLVVICRDEQVSVDNWTSGGVPRLEAEIHDRHWRLLQEDLVKLSRSGNLIEATGCDHMIHLENADIIYSVLETIR